MSKVNTDLETEIETIYEIDTAATCDEDGLPMLAKSSLLGVVGMGSGGCTGGCGDGGCSGGGGTGGTGSGCGCNA